MTNETSQYKKYLKVLFGIIAFILLSIGSLNLIMDPLWNFSHSHFLNKQQLGFDERQQKTNRVLFQPFDYNALLFGSSRAALLDQNKLSNDKLKAYNYAISLAMPQEFGAYINLAKQKRGKDFDTIFLELDFYGTNKNNKHAKDTESKEIALAKEPGYRWKTLFSFTTTKYSLFNIARLILGPGQRSYDRKNIAFTAKFPEDSVKKNIQKITLKKAIGMEDYAYNEHYKDILIKLKKENPNTTFVTFTSPVSAYYLDLLFEEGLKGEYKRWLKDLTSVFGTVTHFMDHNTITDNYPKYFLDYHHVYPEVQGIMAEKVMGKEVLPKDFGQINN